MCEVAVVVVPFAFAWRGKVGSSIKLVGIPTYLVGTFISIWWVPLSIWWVPSFHFPSWKFPILKGP